MPGDDDDLLPELSPEALARAEAALAALSGDFRAWVEADLARLRAALDPFQPARLFAIAHDIKGQAGTFGYPVATELANRLCRLIEAGRLEPIHAAALVEALAEALPHSRPEPIV